jgi:hypothetical protein
MKNLLLTIILFTYITCTIQGLLTGLACCTTACTACNSCSWVALWWNFGPIGICIPECMLMTPLLAPCSCGGTWPNVCIVAEAIPVLP